MNRFLYCIAFLLFTVCLSSCTKNCDDSCKYDYKIYEIREGELNDFFEANSPYPEMNDSLINEGWQLHNIYSRIETGNKEYKNDKFVEGLKRYSNISRTTGVFYVYKRKSVE